MMRGDQQFRGWIDGLAESLRRVLVRKGLVNNDEMLEEVKAVRRELEAKRGR